MHHKPSAPFTSRPSEAAASPSHQHCSVTHARTHAHGTIPLELLKAVYQDRETSPHSPNNKPVRKETCRSLISGAPGACPHREGGGRRRDGGGGGRGQVWSDRETETGRHTETETGRAGEAGGAERTGGLQRGWGERGRWAETAAGRETLADTEREGDSQSRVCNTFIYCKSKINPMGEA